MREAYYTTSNFSFFFFFFGDEVSALPSLPLKNTKTFFPFVVIRKRKKKIIGTKRGGRHDSAKRSLLDSPLFL